MKIQSDAKIKKCEESMPVLYDKQWYENVADGIKSGLNDAGQTLVGMGWGGINFAKDILLAPKYVADGLCDFINNDPIGKINDFPAYVLNGGIDNQISNQFQQFTIDYQKANTEKQSEMVMNILGNVALLFIPATAITKFGKTGEAVEVAGDAAKVEKGTEALKDIPKIEKGAKTLEDAGKAAKAAEEAKLLKEAEKAAKAAEAEKAAEEANLLRGADKAEISQSKINEILSMERGTRPNPSTYLSKEYISNHLAKFDGGVTRISANAPSGIVGPPGGTFVMPESVADALIKQSTGDVTKLEKLLSLKPGTLGSKPVRVDIASPEGLRMPSGNEFGANSQWIPGGYTGGKVLEATIDPVPPGKYTVTPIK